jgi:hypothetical protein
MFEKQLNEMYDRASSKHDHQFNNLIDRLDRIIFLLQNISYKETIIMATDQDIQTAVAAQSTVADSVVTLLNGINQQLKDAIASNDPAALDAIVASITANTTKLSDAVTANTTVAPTPVTVPVVTPTA